MPTLGSTRLLVGNFPSSSVRLGDTMRISVIRAVTLALALALLTSGSAAASGHAASGGSSAFVRVNQVGYPAGASKRAYLMASAADTGATFAVKNSSGATVVSGPIGARL